ncbi:MAG TPA: hypothetical protein VE136_03645, partial [Anaerolineales bacterium]|nr:hypothetical protein [Anaerolineales bacterium]
DISDLSALAQVGAYDVAHEAMDVDVSGQYAFIADGYIGLRAVEAVVEIEPQLVGTAATQGNAEDVAVKDNLAYLAAGESGVRVLDVSDPRLIREIGFYDTPGQALAVTIAGDFILVADGNEGLHVLFLSNPDPANLRLEEISSLEVPGRADGVAASGTHIYVAAGDAGLIVVDFSDPSAPTQVGVESAAGNAVGVAAFGDYAYVAAGGDGLRVVDVSDPTRPAVVGTYDTPGDARAVTVASAGDRLYAYVADGSAGLRVVDVTDPRQPIEVGFNDQPDFVQDVVVAGDLDYLASRQDGLWILDVSDRSNPQELGFYDTPGEAHGLFLAGDLVYVAAYDRGLRVINVAVPQVPVEVGFYDAPKIVQHVAVEGDYAYLTDGQRGLRIVDISTPRQPREIGFNDQLGGTQGLAVRQNLAYVTNRVGLEVVDVNDPSDPARLGSIATSGDAVGVALEGNYAFIADGGQGLSIVDIGNPAELKLVGVFNTPGYAWNVSVAGNYAYIADGDAGLYIVNISDPADPQTTSVLADLTDARGVLTISNFLFLADGVNGLKVVDIDKPAAPELIGSLDTPGTALAVASSGVYVFIADGPEGVEVAYVINPAQPVQVGSFVTEGGSLEIAVEPGPVEEGQPGHFYIYAAAGEHGLQVLNAEKSAVIVGKGIYESPGNASLRQVVSAFLGALTGQGVSRKALRTAFQMVVDFGVIGFLGLFVWLAFFSQFVLPLKHLSERMNAFNRLVLYLFGGHGPAIRIEDGVVRERPGESERHGPGVALLDTTSAAMLRSKTAFTRTAGPGVVFTAANEFVHQEAMDLYVQVRPIPALGPTQKPTPQGTWEPESPFEPRQADESEEEYQIRQDRRRDTSGWTRDGVEVVPNILAIFKLISKKGQGFTQFGYNPESVRLAITREGVVPEALRHVRWFELPAYLAVDLWREYLGKFTLNELFDPDTAQEKGLAVEQEVEVDTPSANSDATWAQRGETGLEIIKRMVRARLTQSAVEELDSVGKPAGNQLPSREYEILNAMGIQALGASISNLQFPPVIEDQLVQQWLSTWLKRAQEERQSIEQQRSYAVHEGKNLALKEYAGQVKRHLEARLLDPTGKCKADRRAVPELASMLAMLLEGTQDLVVRDTRIHRFLEEEEKALMDMIDWVRRNGA